MTDIKLYIKDCLYLPKVAFTVLKEGNSGMLMRHVVFIYSGMEKERLSQIPNRIALWMYRVKIQYLILKAMKKISNEQLQDFINDCKKFIDKGV